MAKIVVEEENEVDKENLATNVEENIVLENVVEENTVAQTVVKDDIIVDNAIAYNVKVENVVNNGNKDKMIVEKERGIMTGDVRKKKKIRECVRGNGKVIQDNVDPTQSDSDS